MPLTTSTTRAATFMPWLPYAYFSPGCDCRGPVTELSARAFNGVLSEPVTCCSSDEPASPLVWLSRWRMVTGRAGGFSRTWDASFSSTTIHRSSCGMNLVTGLSRESLPSSTSIMTDAPANIFVIDAIQNTLSSPIGFFASTSAKPIRFR